MINTKDKNLKEKNTQEKNATEKHTKEKHTCWQACSGICCTKIANLGVVIGQNEILHDVNMHIHCGELTALIGPNGSGKSTLLKAMLGEIKHTGKFNFLDSLGKQDGPPLIGYVPQHVNLDPGSPTSVLDLFMACTTKVPAWLYVPKNTRAKVEESLDRVQAGHLIDRRLAALSGGELQKVLLALAIDPIPNLLLLDEPVSGIDQKGMELFYNTVVELKKNYDLSIILVSHDLDLVAKYADRVVLLNKTVICEGKPQEVFRDERLFQIFGRAWCKNNFEEPFRIITGGNG